MYDVFLVKSFIYQKLWGKHKSSIQDFIDFAIKTYIIFFTNSSQVSFILTYYCLILLYLYDFEPKQRKQILNFFSIFNGFS